MVWCYESFMYLKGDYLRTLYDFLGVESDFVPELFDTNRSKVRKVGVFGGLWTVCQISF